MKDEASTRRRKEKVKKVGKLVFASGMLAGTATAIYLLNRNCCGRRAEVDAAASYGSAPAFDLIDEASMESFPASDPPSWIL